MVNYYYLKNVKVFAESEVEGGKAPLWKASHAFLKNIEGLLWAFKVPYDFAQKIQRPWIDYYTLI